jgi:uncharacterized protein (TIGR03437 family)
VLLDERRMRIDFMNVSGSFSKLNQILGTTCVLFAISSSQAIAQSVTIAVGSGSAAPGAVVTLPVTITASGSAQPSDVEWTMGYSSSDISSVSVTAGPSAIAASKSATCSSLGNSTTCVVSGMNSNIIGNGTLATVTFTVASTSLHTSTPIPLSGVAVSNGSGSSIPGTGVAGTITIIQPVQPTLTGLTCTPSSVNSGGVSACTVTLSSAALTGGFAVALASNNAYLTVPASVTVAAGAVSAGFSASVAATVPTSQTAIVTASAGSTVKTFSLNIAASAWTITGGVGTSGSGATIALTGTSTATTTANASGVYTFSGLANGSYTITPSLTGYTFSPVSVAVTVSGANVTAASFTATAQTWTITGGVGTAGSGATIALTGASTATTTANASGVYTFSGLANGSYTITPSLSGYAFSPVSVAVTVSGANVTAASFTATAQTWTITGGVGTAGSGATIALTGTSTATTTANASGSYTFSGLANGAYTVTPSKSGYTFSPVSVAVTVSGANVTAASFTATAQTWTITGGVGTSGSGATIALTGTATATTTANASGAYTFSGLANGSYTLTPSLTGFTFSPASLAVTVSGANVTAASFTATAQTWTITGGVGTSGSGATIALTGTSTATTTANASGSYTFSGLANGAYTVTPSKTGYTFSPASVAVTVSGANVTAASFTATPQTWTITGGVGTSGSGATIALTGTSTATTTANASGAYTFSGLANGSYTITPSLTGYTFSPASVAVTVSGANVTAPSFTAQSTLGPITVDASVSVDRSASSSSITIPALSTVSGNELLLALVATGDRTRKLTSPTVTGITGGGLTWVRVKRTDVQKGASEIWRAFASTPLTGVSISATLSQSVPASMTIMSFTGVNTTGTNGSGAIGSTASGEAGSGAPTATLIATHSGSLVIGVGNDPKNALARTVGPGQTLLHQYLDSTTDTYWVQKLSSATVSGASITINDSAPTSDSYNLSIVEILAGQLAGAQMTGLVTPAAVTAAKATNPTNSIAPAAPPVLAIITTGEAGEACSPGGLASLLGAGLTGGQTQSSTTQPLPTQLAAIQVMINGIPAPLLLASSSQINFQCPLLPQGTAMEIQVESANGVTMSSLQTVMQAAVPLLFQLDARGRGYVTIGGTNEIATAATGALPSRPAKRGEVLTIHATGLGEVVNGVDAGTAAPLNRPVPTKAQIKLVLGGMEIDQEFAGLTPGTVGLYQVNVLVPTEVSGGSAVPLYLKMTLPDGTIVRSNSVTVAISDATEE